MSEEQEIQFNLIPYKGDNIGGAYPDRFDSRDYLYDEEALGAAVEIPIPWEEEFHVEQKLNHVFKVENQGASQSCVGQSWQKYAEILNFIETGIETDLSAKFIYSQIYLLPDGGAYIRDGVKVAVDQGVTTEELLPSYKNGEPPDEAYMRRSQDITEGARKEALTYQGKEYRMLVNGDIDWMARAIMNNAGCVTGARGTSQGWGQLEGKVRPPLPGERIWGHAIYCCGFGLDEGKKYIEFINSWSKLWGKEGKGRIYEDYFQSGHMFSPWTLTDKPNVEDTMIEIINVENDERFWAKSIKDKGIYHIGGWETYQEGLKAGWFLPVKTVANLEGYEKRNSFGFIK